MRANDKEEGQPDLIQNAEVIRRGAVRLASRVTRIFLLVVLFRRPFRSPVIFLYDKLVRTDGECGSDDSNDDYRKHSLYSDYKSLLLIALFSISARMGQLHLTRR